MQAGHDEVAAQAFEAASRLDNNPAALLDLGIALTNLGRVHDAVGALQRYLRSADPRREARNIAAVKQEIERLERASARILLKLTPHDATLHVDGAALVSRDATILLGPGRHRFLVSAKGFVSYDRTLQVKPGDLTLEVTLHRPEEFDLAAKQASKAAGDQPAKATAAPEPRAPARGEAGPCALGTTCLGPTFDLGLPNVLGGGLQLRIGQYFGASLDFQVLPSLTLGAASASATLVTVNGRAYPFGGALFLAAGFAYQSIHGRVDDGQLAADAKVGMPAFSAGIGFMGHDGFVLGVDLAFVIPLGGAKVSVRDLSGAPAGSGITQAEIDRVRADAKKGVEQILDFLPVLLQLNLIRIGYLF